MLLFTRMATLGGNPRDSMAWAAEMLGLVNDKSDHTMTLWQANFGYPVGSVAWSTWAESQQALGDGFAPLLADDGYFDMLDKGEAFVTTPAEDTLREALFGGPTGDPPPIGAVTTLTTAVIAGGQYTDGVAWGIGMAQLVEEVTNLPTIFLMDSFGTFGQVTWLSGAPDAAASDAANAALSNGNDEYMKRLGAVGELFVPSSGHRGQATRCRVTGSTALDGERCDRRQVAGYLGGCDTETSLVPAPESSGARRRCRPGGRGRCRVRRRVAGAARTRSRPRTCCSAIAISRVAAMPPEGSSARAPACTPTAVSGDGAALPARHGPAVVALAASVGDLRRRRVLDPAHRLQQQPLVGPEELPARTGSCWMPADRRSRRSTSWPSRSPTPRSSS